MDIDRTDTDHTHPDRSGAGGRLTAQKPRRVALSPVPAEHAQPPGPFVIDCADCVHRSTPVCDDCVVSFIVRREADDAVVVDADEARAVRMLEHAGLLPGVRHARHAV